MGEKKGGEVGDSVWKRLANIHQLLNAYLGFFF